jgi:hypothetical protein
MIYPYSKPIILTDALFSDYGGHIANSLDGQRNAAYLISEQQLSEDLETYLLPTIITGTYSYNPTDKFLILENTYVTKIISTSFLDTSETVYWSQAGTDNIYLSLRNSEYGLVDIHWLSKNCGCSYAFPYKIQEVYECGFSSGTSYKPDILLALTTYADVILNEIIGYGNEAVGDVGVQDFSNQQYRESRVPLIKTSFGSSARAQFVRKLIQKYRRPRYVGML